MLLLFLTAKRSLENNQVQYRSISKVGALETIKADALELELTGFETP